jgi:hypothetical protein
LDQPGTFSFCSRHRHAVHNLAPGVAVAVEVGDLDVIARAQRAKE